MPLELAAISNRKSDFVNRKSDKNTVADLPRRTSVRIDRIRERMDELGLNATEVARIGGLERTFVSELLGGKKNSIRRISLKPLATALQCAPEYLTGEVEELGGTPEAAPTFRMVRGDGDFLEVLATTRSGVFQVSDQTRGVSPVTADRRFLGKRQGVFRVGGDELEGQGFMRGAFLTTIHVEDYVEAMNDLPSGAYAIVSTTVEGIRGREITVRRIGRRGQDLDLRYTLEPATKTVVGGSQEIPTLDLDPSLVSVDGARRSVVIGIVTSSTIVMG